MSDATRVQISREEYERLKAEDTPAIIKLDMECKYFVSIISTPNKKLPGGARTKTKKRCPSDLLALASNHSLSPSRRLTSKQHGVYEFVVEIYSKNIGDRMTSKELANALADKSGAALSIDMAGYHVRAMLEARVLKIVKDH